MSLTSSSKNLAFLSRTECVDVMNGVISIHEKNFAASFGEQARIVARRKPVSLNQAVEALGELSGVDADHILLFVVTS